MNKPLIEIATHRQGMLLLLALAAVLSLVVYWDFLTFTHLYLYKDIGSDTINVFYPEYVHLADYMRSDGWPAWSFSQGMGQNIFPHGIGDPFDLILVLMGSEYLAYGLAYVQVLKILLAGTIFYLYLRVLSLPPLVGVTGALLYAFSGFMILGGTWYIFSTDAVYFALLLYAFERFLKDGVWGYFCIGVALVVAAISFNLYLYAMFFLPYTLFRYYLVYGWQWRNLSIFTLKLIGIAVLGLGISAIFLFANLQEMVNSPRFLGEASFFDRLMEKGFMRFEGYAHNHTAILRFFSSDILGTGSEFRGWYNYLEAPMFYCGLLSLLLAPQVFIALERKQKVAYVLFGLVFLIPVVVPFFRHLFWAFSGEYYRLFSVFVAFLLLFFSLHGLNCITKSAINTRLLIATILILFAILFSPFVPATESRVMFVDRNLRWMASAFLIVYAVLLLAMRQCRFQLIAQWGLLLVVVVELASFSWITVNDRQIVTVDEYQARIGYNDYSNEAINKIKEKDSGFYRVEKTYKSGPAVHSSLNDAKVQQYMGTSSYHSFNQLSYIQFLNSLGVLSGANEAQTRWAKGLVNEPLLLSFASVKYLLVKNPEHLRTFSAFGFQGVEKIEDVFIMANPLYLPFGFTYDSYIALSKFESYSKASKNVALMRAVVLDQPDKTITSLLNADDSDPNAASYGIKQFAEDVGRRRADSFQMSHFSHNLVKGTIELKESQFLFFTIPFDDGWSVTVNGKEDSLVQANIGFSGLMLDSGKHEISLEYNMPYFNVSVLISVISFIVFMLCMVVMRKPVHQ